MTCCCDPVVVDELQREGLVAETSDGPAAAPTPLNDVEGKPFATPRLEKYDDLRDLVLLDPVHQVDQTGWPAPAPDDSALSGARTRRPMHASQPEVAATDWALERLSGVESSFQAACERTGGASDDRFSIAGLVVRLRFGSPALRDSLTRALAHLAQPSGVTSVEPALTVHLWDSATSGAPPPPTPAVPPSERPYRDAKLFADPEVTPTPAQLHAAGPLYYADDPPVRVAYYPALQALSILDRDASQAWHWVGDANDQPYWQEASPIRQILYWFLSGSGILHLHASSVGTPAGGVVAVGKGGSGKSTVALANLGGELLTAVTTTSPCRSSRRRRCTASTARGSSTRPTCAPSCRNSCHCSRTPTVC